MLAIQNMPLAQNSMTKIEEAFEKQFGEDYYVYNLLDKHSHSHAWHIPFTGVSS
jgi:hypothetical protein